ncbi:glycine zipper 2TM domain-containing protein [Thiolapillus sp.]
METSNLLKLSTSTLLLLSLFNLSACSDSGQQEAETPSADAQQSQPEFAEVIKIEEVIKKSDAPKEVCKDVPVTQKVQPKDDKQIAGTVAGAALGGVLGNQIGGGRGKKLATVAGVVAGGVAGNKVQENAQNKKTTTTMQRKCETVMETKEELVGYEVTYRIGDKEAKVQMKEKPGKQIPLKNGKPDLP